MNPEWNRWGCKCLPGVSDSWAALSRCALLARASLLVAASLLDICICMYKYISNLVCSKPHRFLAFLLSPLVILCSSPQSLETVSWSLLGEKHCPPTPFRYPVPSRCPSCLPVLCSRCSGWHGASWVYVTHPRHLSCNHAFTLTSPVSWEVFSNSHADSSFTVSGLRSDTTFSGRPPALCLAPSFIAQYDAHHLTCILYVLICSLCFLSPWNFSSISTLTRELYCSWICP